MVVMKYIYQYTQLITSNSSLSATIDVGVTHSKQNKFWYREKLDTIHFINN